MEENAQMKMREVDEAQLQGESMQCQGAHGWWRRKACCDKGALQVWNRFRIDPLGKAMLYADFPQLIETAWPVLMGLDL